VLNPDLAGDGLKVFRGPDSTEMIALDKIPNPRAPETARTSQLICTAASGMKECSCGRHPPAAVSHGRTWSTATAFAAGLAAAAMAMSLLTQILVWTLVVNGRPPVVVNVPTAPLAEGRPVTGDVREGQLKGAAVSGPDASTSTEAHEAMRLPPPNSIPNGHPPGSGPSGIGIFGWGLLEEARRAAAGPWLEKRTSSPAPPPRDCSGVLYPRAIDVESNSTWFLESEPWRLLTTPWSCAVPNQIQQATANQGTGR
jgi:hypothetical protein